MKRKLLFAIFAATMCFGLTPFALALNSETEEEYPITEPHIFEIIPGTEEWDSYESLFERIDACYVPEEELKQMTTSALYETVLNYPLLVNIYAYDGDLRKGIDSVSKYFGGLEELFSREDALDVIRQHSIDAQSIEDERSEIKAIYDQSLLNYAERLTEQSNNGDIALFAGDRDHIYTPNGTAALVWQNCTWEYWQDYYYDSSLTQENCDILAQEYLKEFSTASLVSKSNPAYNCHSYAWYSQGKNNKNWLLEPEKFIQDGSYILCSQQLDARITYETEEDLYMPGTIEHSGIVTRVSGNPRVTSKWGMNGVFIHSIWDNPYAKNVDFIRYWKSAK